MKKQISTSRLIIFSTGLTFMLWFTWSFFTPCNTHAQFGLTKEYKCKCLGMVTQNIKYHYEDPGFEACIGLIVYRYVSYDPHRN